MTGDEIQHQLDILLDELAASEADTAAPPVLVGTDSSVLTLLRDRLIQEESEYRGLTSILIGSPFIFTIVLLLIALTGYWELTAARPQPWILGSVAILLIGVLLLGVKSYLLRRTRLKLRHARNIISMELVRRERPVAQGEPKQR